MLSRANSPDSFLEKEKEESELEEEEEEKKVRSLRFLLGDFYRVSDWHGFTFIY